MFRILINHTKNYTDKYVKQQTRQFAQAHRYRPNQGIRRQAKAGTNEIENESHQWDDDDISRYEGDLSNTADIYEQYKQESRTESENLKRNIVRNKYFSEKKLSFLTWAEMEQIRLLNTKDPEEWDDQKLAESFPADVSTIRKILKGKWQPKDPNRIAKHDERVRLNWKSFMNGEISDMDIDGRLKEHLQKFSTRNLNQKTDYDSVLKKEMPKPKSTEFLGIITSCKKYKDEPKQIAPDHSLPNQIVPQKPSKKERSKSDRIDSHKLYTFKPTPTTSSKVDPVNSNAEIIFGNPNGTEIKKKIDSNEQSAITVNSGGISKFETNEVQLDQNDLKLLSVASIRHRIDIPEKLFKEGATYRLEDCYYDDDGEFLYRVPGMTKL